MNNPFKLDTKTALVPGASSGLGREFAKVLAGAGANVVAAARTRAEIELVAKAINTEGKRALAIAADVTCREDVEQLVERTTGEFCTIDILVNNAGTIIVKPLVPTVGRSPTMAELVPGFDQGVTDDD